MCLSVSLTVNVSHFQLQCFFVDYKKVDYNRICFSLTPHVFSTRIKKKTRVQLSAKIGTNSLFARPCYHQNNQLNLLTGALLVVDTKTTILNKS